MLEIINDASALEAVKNDGMMLEHVVKQTNEICLAAVQQNPKAVQFVKNFVLKIKLSQIYGRPEL